MAIGDLFQRVFEYLSPSTSRPQFDKEAQLAATEVQAVFVDGYIRDLNSPMALEQKSEFELGITLLDVPCFTSRELLELSDDPSDAIWQMGVMAVSRRDADPQLVGPLLALFDDGGPWHKYFVMKALLVHTPAEQSLAGEFIFRHLKHEAHRGDFPIKIMAPVLNQRLEDGEKPSFGRLLDNLDAEKADGLQEILTSSLDSPLRKVVEPL